MALGGTRGASFDAFTLNDQIFEMKRPTFKIFKSDFSFLYDRVRPCGTLNIKYQCYRILCLENSGRQGLKRLSA